FYQQEDAIGFSHVTGVQTCALPIFDDVPLRCGGPACPAAARNAPGEDQHGRQHRQARRTAAHGPAGCLASPLHVPVVSERWINSACSRCAWIAGRTPTSVCFSSAFFAFGISVSSIAWSTARWYATSLSMYARSNSAPDLVFSVSRISAACASSERLTSFSRGVTPSRVTSSAALLFTAV